MEETTKSTFLKQVEARDEEAKVQPSTFDRFKALYEELSVPPTDLTIKSLLSASGAFDAATTLQASLTGAIGGTPYLQYKIKYLDPNKKQTTIAELPPPKCRSILKIRDRLSDISKYHANNLLTQLPLVTASPEKHLAAAATIFSSLSGDTVITDNQKMREHFEFIELIQTMTSEDINTRPVTTALKLINEYIRVYSPPLEQIDSTTITTT